MNLDPKLFETRIKKSEHFWTTKRDEAVKIRMREDGMDSVPPKSVPCLFHETVQKYADEIALKFRDKDNTWRSLNYREYEESVVHMAKAFIKLGLEERNSVAVLSNNRPEWFISELGAVYANGIIAGIYANNSPEAIHHAVLTSNANIIVIEDSIQLKKVLQIREQLSVLKCIIQIEGPFADDLTSADGYYKWSDIEEMNFEMTNEIHSELERRLGNVAVNECFSIVYTSGTVGMPKGVLLSHDNVIFNCSLMKNEIFNGHDTSQRHLVIAYLPPSHIMSQIFDVFLVLLFGSTLQFAEKDALTTSIIDSLIIGRPTMFAAVPRIWEKIIDKLTSIELQLTSTDRVELLRARDILTNYSTCYEKIFSIDEDLYQKARRIVKKYKSMVGLDECQYTFIGSAPIAKETKIFLWSYDLNVVELYGMSEAAGAQCHSSERSDPRSVGRSYKKADIVIREPNNSGEGEINFRGRNVFMGYLDNLEKTCEVLGDDGWLRSGDAGHIDENGNVYITGRIKDIIITSGGENIPPVRIEQFIKKYLPGIGHAVLIGDRRKYLTMLVTIKTESNSKTGEPLDDLSPEVLEWMKSLDLSYKTLKHILEAGPCPKVMQSIQNAINYANENAISRAQRVQKFAILPRDFSIFHGELGNTLKLRRNIITDMYADIIEKLYKN